VRVLTLPEADAIEAEMRRVQNDPSFSKEAVRLFMQAPMPCGHAAGNLMTCDREPFGCVICNAAPCSEAGMPQQDTSHRVKWFDEEVAGVKACGSLHEFTVINYPDRPARCPDCGKPFLLFQRQYIYAAERGAPPPEATSTKDGIP
jgi:hypothetical protein